MEPKSPPHSQEQKEKQEKEQKEPSEYEMQLEMQRKQEEFIRNEIEAQCPLVGELRDLITLLDEFITNEGFYVKVQHMLADYRQYRKTRRDGSCFYRALTFSLLERVHIGRDLALRDKLVDKLRSAKEMLIKAGLEGMIFEDIQDLFIEKLNQPQGNILALMCDPEISNYLVLMMRFLTSGQLRNNAALYETFIDTGIPMEHFCQLEVEPIDKQADQLQIMALLNYLKICIRIVYLDANPAAKQPYTILLPEGSPPSEVKATFLYRPGHYDVLYS